MAQYIDKSALVAEINNIGYQHIWAYNDVKDIINALGVKNVDLDVMQRMEECPYRQVGCTMYEGKILECRGACSYVVDYPKLKELKAQKEE